MTELEKKLFSLIDQLVYIHIVHPKNPRNRHCGCDIEALKMLADKISSDDPNDDCEICVATYDYLKREGYLK